MPGKDVALSQGVCPYYLSQDMLHWSDVVVGDYNYYFDVNAMLYAQAQANQWRISVHPDVQPAHEHARRCARAVSGELSGGSQTLDAKLNIERARRARSGKRLLRKDQ